ncbi:MAG: Calx-beta domain-containing protein [Pyrinomonadaceae bacterium]
MKWVLTCVFFSIVFTLAAFAIPFTDAVSAFGRVEAAYRLPFLSTDIGKVGTKDRFVKNAATDLFISEYIEGSSNNKAIEIYNGTGGPIDLGTGNYVLQLYSNGAAAPSQSFNLDGIIADGDVFVLSRNDADAAILAVIDVAAPIVINFNGDDAIVLRKGGVSGTILDVFGQIGFDPGTEWGTGLTSTLDNTLVRKSSICSGDTDGGNAFDPSVEWDGFANNTFTNLGSHTANCGGGSPGAFSWTEDFPVYGEESGVKVFTIQRTGGSAGTASVTVNTSDVTAAGGAICGTDVDYVAVTDGVVTFLDGETSKTVNVSICNDALFEGNEVFNILLSNPTGGAVIGLPFVSQSTIVDDDIPSAQFGATAYAGREGGTASVTVTRIGATNATADVNFTTGGGTAVSGTCGDPGVDFFPASGVVHFDVGESAKDITFTFCSDSTNEPAGETFDVNLPNGISVVIGSPATATVTILERPVNGMWVFGGSTVPDPVSDPGGRSNMIVRSSNDGISELYVSVYQSTDNANGRRMYEDDDMAAMIAAAHLVGQEVWAAYGAPDWPTFGCTAGDFPVQRMAEVAAYNASRPANERFDGVMLDVEPAPASEAEFQALIAHYECMRASLPAEVKLGAAINAFWDDDPVTYPASGGSIKPASEHIIDLDLDRVIVMGYRDAAGTDTCPSSNGIICLDKAEIDYAGSIGKVGVVLAGLETKLLVSSTGMTGNETFYEEGNVAMDNESSVVENYFAGSTAFGGFAIHNYADAYLGGDTGWPFGPTAAPASISGRVMTADGSGLRNASVTIQGGNLAGTRNVATSTFGYFRFDGLEAGLTYVVTVSSRRYSFTQPTRLVNLSENVEGLDFVASP